MSQVGRHLVIVLALVGAGALSSRILFPPQGIYRGAFTDGRRHIEGAEIDGPRLLLWGEAENLGGQVNSLAAEGRPALDPSGELLFFQVGRPGENVDLWIAEMRAGRIESARPLHEVNSPADDMAPACDGDHLYFASNRDGGRGGLDLYRAAIHGGRLEEAEWLGGAVNSAADETDPVPRPGRAALYFSSNRGPARDFDIYVAALDDAGAGVARRREELSSPFEDREVCFSPDGNTAWLASDRMGGRGRFDLWRTTVDGEQFLPLEPLEELNTAADERGPWVTDGGFTLLFASDHGRDAGALDLFRASSRELYRIPSRPNTWLDFTYVVLLLLVALLAWLAKRWAALEIIYKCLVLSLLIHLALLAWFKRVEVGAPEILADRSGTSFRVHLAVDRTGESLRADPSRITRGEHLDETGPPTGTESPVRASTELAPHVARASEAVPIERVDSTLPEPAPRQAPEAAPLAREMPAVAHHPEIAEPRMRYADRSAEVALDTLSIEMRHARDVARPTRKTDAGPRTPPTEAGRLPPIERSDASWDLTALAPPEPTPRRSAERPERGTRPEVTIGAPHEPRPTGSPGSESVARDQTPSGWLVDARPLDANVVAAAAPRPRPAAGVGTSLPDPSPPSADLVTGPAEARRTLAPPEVADRELRPLARHSEVAPRDVGPPTSRLAPIEETRAAGTRADSGTRDDPTATAPAGLDLPPADGLQERHIALDSLSPRRGAIRVDALPPARPAGLDRPDGLAPLPRERRVTAPEVPSPGRHATSLADLEPRHLASENMALPPASLLAREDEAPVATPRRPVGEAPRRLAADLEESGPLEASPIDPRQLVSLAPMRRRDPGPSAAPLLVPPRLEPLVATSGQPVPAAETPPLSSATPDLYRSRFGSEKSLALERFGGSAETERAVARGLRYLAGIQNRQGYWGNRDGYDDKYGYVLVGKTGLCLLAFLGAGHTPDSGTAYSEATRRAIEFLLAVQDEESGHFGYTTSYSHGVATYALAECYALTRMERLRGPLERAVRHIIAEQHDDPRDRRSYGGWGYYYPDGRVFDRWPRASITAWQVMALKSARLGGIDVPDTVFDAAAAFLDGCFDRRRGSYRYNHDPSRLSSRYPVLPGSTPASLFALGLIGHQTDASRTQKAYRFVIERRPRAYRSRGEDAFVFQAEGNLYFWYYGSLACFFRGGETWKEWNAGLQQALLPAQDEEGSWRPISVYAEYAGDTEEDRSYTTAMCVLMLEVYYRYFTPLLDWHGGR